ncbi:MAG: CBS and ACT domain-containing protein [Bellilinea sp.]
MLVGERMSHPVLTISPDVAVQDALARMRREKVRRYPVVDKNGKMVGIVTSSDLMNATPSEATTLSVWEINYLLSKITVERVMTKDVLTTCETCPIEDAALIMADKKIGGLPVMRGDDVVGIITETDLFKLFIEMLGARVPGVRLSVEMEDKPGKLFDLTGVVRQLGGNIHGLGTMLGGTTSTQRVTLKISGVNMEELRKAVEPVVVNIRDLRQMSV